MQTLATSLGGFIVAFGVGLIIGVDRERQKGSGPDRSAAGVRTFALVALLGAAAASQQSVALVVLLGAGTAALAVAAYLRSRAADPGITTEVALLVTYALGVLAITKPGLAAGLGVLAALLLASRSSIHKFVHQHLSDQEELDAILLAAAALVVLPMLPDHSVDPYGVVNPQVIWRLTVVVMLINAFGYVALRMLGASTGLAAAGFFGGFVSSTATIGTFGQRARQEPEVAKSAVAGAALSSVATVAQLALVLGVTYPALLARMSLPLLLMGAVTAIYGAAFLRSAVQHPPDMRASYGRAFQPGYALLFAAAVTTLLLVCAFLADRFGHKGAMFGIALTGFGDAHSAAASAARLFAAGKLDEPAAVWALLLAIAANSITKVVVASLSGGWRYARVLAPGILLALAAFVAGTWL